MARHRRVPLVLDSLVSAGRRAAARSAGIAAIVLSLVLAIGAPLALPAEASEIGPVGDEQQAADSGAALLAAHDESCPDGHGGRLVATRECRDFDCETTDVVLARLDASGREIASAVINEGEDSLYDHNPVALACAGDRVTVAWTSLQGCPAVRDYELDASPRGAIIRIGSPPACSTWWSVVRGMPGGRFVALRDEAVYDSDGSHLGFAIRADVFDRRGVMLARDVTVAPYETRRPRLDLDTAADGTMLLAWQRDHHEKRGVFARVLEPPASAVGEVYRLDTHPDGWLDDLHVIAHEDGTFRVLWSNAARGGLVARTFVADPAVVVTTTTTTTTTTLAQSDMPQLRAPVHLTSSGVPFAMASDGRTTLSALVSFDKYADAPIAFVRSTDGGRTWTRPLALGGGEPQVAAIANDEEIWVAAIIEPTSADECFVRLLRTTDAGATWQETRVLTHDDVFAESVTCGDLAIASDGSGGWAAAWTTLRIHDDRPSTSTVSVALSFDGASTWSEEREIATATGEWLRDPALAANVDGGWLVGWLRAPQRLERGVPTVSRLSVTGAPSTPRAIAPIGASSGNDTTGIDAATASDLQLASAADGSWVAAWVEAGADETGNDGDVVIAHSEDGRAWTAPIAMAPYATRDEANDRSPRLATAAGGDVLLAWTSHFDFGGTGTDGDLLAVRSRDGGRTWSAPGVFGASAAVDRSTDSLTATLHVRDDVWAALWAVREPKDVYEQRAVFARTHDEACGDHELDADEACDDGNRDDGDGCDSNCTPTACGNGIVTAGEACDDGNSWPDDDCSECAPTFCGDGFVNPSLEECDDGNRDDADACRNDCRLAVCGDGVLAAGVEDCDDGNTYDWDGCGSTCTYPECGNGIVEEGELCDDGNDSETDDCTSTCGYAYCGDGVLRIDPEYPEWGEQCDDGNTESGDGCDSSCRPTGCGSGVRTGDEQCDDGNLDDGDDCLANCTRARCGDGVLYTCDQCLREAEQCDDANLIDGDGCDSTCRFTGCGSGVVTGDEECDDGNASNYDACLTDCRVAVCGDGEVQASVEECDDRNTAGGDGCSAECVYEGECGDPNGDGRVTASDARQVLLRSTNELVYCPMAACDVNVSGFIDTTDALGTLRYAVGLYHETVCRRPVRIVFSVPDSVRLGALQWRLDYTGLPGHFVGVADLVACASDLDDVLKSFNHDSYAKTLTAGMISIPGFSGPSDVAYCIFERWGPREALAFDVVVENAATTDLVELPDVVVTAEER